MSGTPWVCRPPQLSGAAQIEGLDAGRTNAGQSPREPVGFDPARIGRPICPRPGSTVPGSENAAHDKAQPAQAWLGGAPQGARVSLWRERCAPVLPGGGIGNHDVALRGAPSPSFIKRGYGLRAHPAPAKQHGRTRMPACGPEKMTHDYAHRLFDNRIGRREPARLSIRLILRSGRSPRLEGRGGHDTAPASWFKTRS